MLYKNQNYCPTDPQNYVNDYLESENFYCVNQKDLKMRKQFAWVFNYPNYPGGFMSQIQIWSLNFQSVAKFVTPKLLTKLFTSGLLGAH